MQPGRRRRPAGPRGAASTRVRFIRVKPKRAKERRGVAPQGGRVTARRQPRGGGGGALASQTGAVPLAGVLPRALRPRELGENAVAQSVTGDDARRRPRSHRAAAYSAPARCTAPACTRACCPACPAKLPRVAGRRPPRRPRDVHPRFRGRPRVAAVVLPPAALADAVADADGRAYVRVGRSAPGLAGTPPAAGRLPLACHGWLLSARPSSTTAPSPIQRQRSDRRTASMISKASGCSPRTMLYPCDASRPSPARPSRHHPALCVVPCVGRWPLHPAGMGCTGLPPAAPAVPGGRRERMFLDLPSAQCAFILAGVLRGRPGLPRAHAAPHHS